MIGDHFRKTMGCSERQAQKQQPHTKAPRKSDSRPTCPSTRHCQPGEGAALWVPSLKISKSGEGSGVACRDTNKADLRSMCDFCLRLDASLVRGRRDRMCVCMRQDVCERACQGMDGTAEMNDHMEQTTLTSDATRAIIQSAERR